MKIALGVTGGIAAYRAAELVRLLQRNDCTVQAILTRSAREFIQPLTFAALTGRKVITEMFGEGDQPADSASSVEHIGLARTIDALVIAPATANVLAKMANGIADDFLTTLYVAAQVPVIVAPAMNVNMWHHPATVENVARLRDRGVIIVDPIEGHLADGMYGAGHLAELDSIVAATLAALGIRRDLEGETVLVTAGPTREDIDPVRYLTNRSSGKMGYAIAGAAKRRGARVILVSGPVNLEPPADVEFVSVRSALEMSEAVSSHFAASTVIIMAAAVADFRPAKRSSTKLKKDEPLTEIQLEPVPDILSALAEKKGDRIIVGFAAETDNVISNARRKLEKKNLDLIVANDVTQEGAGFDVETNVATLISQDGKTIDLPKMGKPALADVILDEVEVVRRRKPAEARLRRSITQ